MSLIYASAIGYYGSRAAEWLTEQSRPGDDFLARVCVDWEREAMRAEEFGVRVVCIRTGVVLGRDGGALRQMLLPSNLAWFFYLVFYIVFSYFSLCLY